jgi:hypothetical protein
MKIQGVIYKIEETQNVSEKFRKRDFVLEIKNNEAYVQKVLFTLIMDKVDEIESFSTGEEVEVDFNLQGKEWTSPSGEVKFFNTLSVYKINKIENQTVQTYNKKDLTQRVHLDKGAVLNNDVDDDLPF